MTPYLDALSDEINSIRKISPYIEEIVYRLSDKALKAIIEELDVYPTQVTRYHGSPRSGNGFEINIRGMHVVILKPGQE